jgi:pectinesterase
MRIVLTGDSTVTDKAGWGPGFRGRLAPGAACLNFARGGRSSKSYRDEGFWDEAVKAEADYLFLQFGHNDQPGKGPERETDPETSFAANLAAYAAEARAAGRQPVLITSLTRRTFDESGRLDDTLGPWVVATRRVAADTGTLLIDLYRASTALCTELGPAGCEKLSPPKPGPALDRTHLNAEGALVFGNLVADLVREEIPELRPWINPA